MATLFGASLIANAVYVGSSDFFIFMGIITGVIFVVVLLLSTAQTAVIDPREYIDDLKKEEK